jgi:hypothetical protein
MVGGRSMVGRRSLGRIRSAGQIIPGVGVGETLSTGTIIDPSNIVFFIRGITDPKSTLTIRVDDVLTIWFTAWSGIRRNDRVLNRRSEYRL